MEKIQDFFKHVGERLRNPFLFSYLISWLIVNYKVVVGLLFYRLDDYYSFIELVDRETNLYTVLWYPLIGAIGYTFIFPYFRRFIVLLYTRINQGQEKRTLNILKDGYISTDKYLRLRDSYKQSENKLAEIIEDESKFLKQRNDLHEQVSNLRKDLSGLQVDIEKLQNHVKDLESFKAPRNIDFLNGVWKYVPAEGKPHSFQSFELQINQTNRLITIALNGKIFRVPIRAFIGYDTTIYFEFKEILMQKSTTPMMEALVPTPEFVNRPDADLFQLKTHDILGYYIFKMISETTIQCYTRLQEPILLSKVR